MATSHETSVVMGFREPREGGPWEPGEDREMVLVFIERKLARGIPHSLAKCVCNP
jgi:hypothetical protein